MRSEDRGARDLSPWSVAALDRLEPVVTASLRVRSGFTHGGDAAEAATDLAAELLAACIALRSWLDEAPAPRDEEEAEAELLAAAGVFKNAALLFRNLDEAEAERRAARFAACESMLIQGAHHIDEFLAAIGRCPPTYRPR